MPGFGLLIWLIIGGLAGYAAGNVMDGKRPYGVLGDVGLGILGSMVGGFGLGLLGLSGNGGLISSFITAFLGALLIIWGVRKYKSR